jgi:choline dehydrogenase-like flavoprotein
MLGGSSAINALAWNRASTDEYDAWGTFATTNDWDWDGMLPYFQRAENISAVPLDTYPGVDITGAVSGDDEGRSGAISVCSLWIMT